MTPANISIKNVREAAAVLREHLGPAPLVRSYPLEKELGLPPHRRVWLKDYGWTPVGSFKLMGALNWMAHNLEQIGNRPVVAHSSGNFASGIAFAGMRYGKRVIVVMPKSAPKVKWERTTAFGAQVRNYDILTDHLTGDRERMTREIVEGEQALRAHPYDDPHVISGNGVGGLEIVDDLLEQGRVISHFFCPVSGGGLMAGHALPIADAFSNAKIIGVEPTGADDFRQSLAACKRVRLDRPNSICDGLLSYDVGEHNWPILQRLVGQSLVIEDLATRKAMRWMYQHHGLRCEPSGAIGVAALLSQQGNLDGEGDLVVIVSGRNVDELAFQNWIELD